MPNNRPNNRGGERVYFDFLFSLSFPPPILFQGNPDSTSNQSIQFQFPNCFCKAIEFSYSFVRTFIQDFLHNAVLRVIFHPERYITEMEKKNARQRVDDSFQLELIDHQLSPPLSHLLSLMDRVYNNESRREPRGDVDLDERERNEERARQPALGVENSAAAVVTVDRRTVAPVARDSYLTPVCTICTHGVVPLR